MRTNQEAKDEVPLEEKFAKEFSQIFNGPFGEYPGPDGNMSLLNALPLLREIYNRIRLAAEEYDIDTPIKQNEDKILIDVWMESSGAQDVGELIRSCVNLEF